MECPLGSFRNPITRKCIRIGGDVAKKLAKHRFPGVPGPQVQPSPYPYPYGYPVQPRVQPCPLGKERNPLTGRCKAIQNKTIKKNSPYKYAPTEVKKPVLQAKSGRAIVAPFLDRDSTLRWVYSNCKNTVDPITKQPFTSQPFLTDMIRLHNGTCTLASGLHSKVAADHKAGHLATVPGDPQTHMILDDFNVLRDAMRRVNPSYKIPGHKHTPPPPEWKLYIASDNFSGPDFVSVVFLDITKGKQGPYGVQYPVDSIRINMGFLPINVPNAPCTLDVIIERIKRAHMAGKLLIPIAGGWKPIAGFPFKKEYWARDAPAKINKLCNELTKAMTTFF